MVLPLEERCEKPHKQSWKVATVLRQMLKKEVIEFCQDDKRPFLAFHYYHFSSNVSVITESITVSFFSSNTGSGRL